MGIGYTRDECSDLLDYAIPEVLLSLLGLQSSAWVDQLHGKLACKSDLPLGLQCYGN